MSQGRGWTGRILGVLAVVFIVIIIILCATISTPKGNQNEEGQTGSRVGVEHNTKPSQTTTEESTTAAVERTTEEVTAAVKTTPVVAVETTPEETTPEETTPQETTPVADVETTPEETTPVVDAETTPKETTPEETTPEETTPVVDVETTPEETTPEETTPQETTPVADVETTPEETTPVVDVETTPEETTPEKTTPEETTPVVDVETTPEETTPVVDVETTSEETATEETTPEETTPEETTPVVPLETTPEETTPKETTPVADVETTTEETTPEETTPEETTPVADVETTTEETTPEETTPEETTPVADVETTTEETTPEETTPEETTPVADVETTTEETTLKETTPEETTLVAYVETTTEETTPEETTPEETTLVADVETTTEETTPKETTTEETTPVVPLETTPEETTPVAAVETTTDTSATTAAGEAPPRVYDVCKTTPCKRLAAQMLHVMDNGPAEPCDNFYLYSCGGVMDKPFFQPDDRQFLVREQIKSDLKKVNQSDGLLGPMRTYYDICLNESPRHNKTELNSQFYEAFRSVGYTFDPDTNRSGTTNPRTIDVTSMLANMMKSHFTPFFDVLLDVDDQDPSKFALKITPPLFKSPFTDDLAKSLCLDKHRQLKEETRFKTKRNFDLNQAYDTYTSCLMTDGLQARLLKMRQMIKNMKFWDDMSDELTRTATLEETVIKTNFLLDEINKTEGIPDPATVRSHVLNKVYETFSLDQLLNGDVFNSQFINWRQLVTQLVGGDETGSGYNVHVYFREGLSKVFSKLNEELEFNPGDFHNILLMLWSERLYNDLVEPVNEVAGTESYCYRATVNLMEDFTSFLYLDKLQDKETKQGLIEDMINFNTEAARQMLSRHEDDTEDLSSKLDQMLGKTADLDEIKETLEQNLQDGDYGTELKGMSGNFVGTSMMLLRRYRSRLYKTLPLQPGHPSQLWRQFLVPHSYSGVVIYALNQFLIPFGAMEVPLYHPDVPAYLNYAGIGHMIAHELMHSFDSTGMQYSGNETDTSAMKVPNDYVAKSECIAQRLERSKSHISNTDIRSLFKLNKNLKQNEVLADSGATRLAWEAYLLSRSETFTSDNFVGGPPTGDARRRRSLDWWYPTPSGSGRVRRQASNALPNMHTTEKQLPWLDLTPIQLYFLRIAQNHCSSSSELDLITVMESEHLPPELRVNFIFKNDPLFAKAFKCTNRQPMKVYPQCPYHL